MKKWKHYFCLMLLLFILLFSLVLVGCTTEDKVCFEQNCFSVEKISTPEDMAKGLMYRTSLDINAGMLFIFEKEDIHAFWMKNTLISLDMIWINSSKQVTYIYSGALPCGEGDCHPIIPESNALYVLEINAGLVEKYNISIGDKIELH